MSLSSLHALVSYFHLPRSFLLSQFSMQEKDVSPRGFLPTFQHFATQAIHVGQEPEQWTSRAVVPPISLSTTFKQGAPGQHSVSWVCLGRSRDGRVKRDGLQVKKGTQVIYRVAYTSERQPERMFTTPPCSKLLYWMVQ